MNPGALYAALRSQPLDARAWAALARIYIARGAAWQARYATQMVIRLDASLGADASAAMAARPDLLEVPVVQQVLARRDHPQAQDFLDALERDHARAQGDGDWLNALYRCRLYEMTGRPAQAAQALNEASRLEVIPGESAHWVGVWTLQAGDAARAVDVLRALAERRPPRYGSKMYLGLALFALGQTAQAELAFQEAAQSPSPQFLDLLASKVLPLNYWQEAISIRRRITELQPDKVSAWADLAMLQAESWKLSDAQQTLERARMLAPGDPQLATAARRITGRVRDPDEAFQYVLYEYQKALPLSRMTSVVAMSGLYASDISAEELQALHRRLAVPIEADLGASATPYAHFEQRLDLARRLRIGYITSDLFRQHPVNLFMLPVLERHDRARHDIHIFYTGHFCDEYTRRARAAAARWHDAETWADNELRERILAEEIDILVDLSGHTSGHRLGVMVLRAAPVQVSYLGYPHSTGLSAVDWLIGDPVVSPFGHAALYTEGLALLPHSVFCWAPVDPYPVPPPRPADAPLVLGSFNNAIKLGRKTFALWSRVLHALPQATLLIKAPGGDDPLLQERLRKGFAAQGVDAARIVFRGPSALEDMMAEYGDMDIALDPLPYNGGTTSLQALWMGVPLVTRCGDNFVGRMSSSFLKTLGQDGWVAEDDDAFVRIVCELAADIATVRQGREAQRRRMMASPLCDIGRFTADLEKLYADMWSAAASPDKPLSPWLRRPEAATHTATLCGPRAESAQA
ncbi:MAG: hypothetical protein Q8K31_05150 [Burkholderiaceae bacterium]|nr:hypothetical protein [Burkholderiaceae bacterium]